MSPVMLTLFSDASYDHKTGAAGWGAWARRDGWDRGQFMGGPIRRKIETPNSAEICGIASALHQMGKEGSLSDVEIVVIQCDSTIALGMLLFIAHARAAAPKAGNDVGVLTRPAWKKCRPIDREAIEVVRRLTQGKTIWLRHVRAHQEITHGRSWVNDQCDTEAKRHMNAVRDQLRAAQNFEAVS